MGAGLAGLRAVEAARETGYAGRIVLVGAERHLPYNRPPLSKGFLESDEGPDFFVTDDELRTELRVDVRLGCTARQLDVERRTLSTSCDELQYDQLIIATGASPRTLPNLPRLAGLETLRTVDDAERIRAAITPGAKVVIAGAGFIGSEIASSARQRGAEVTIVEAAAVPLVRAVGETVGAALSDLHRRNGARLLSSTSIASVIGVDRVEAVVLSSGERIAAELVVVGVGAAPATEWLVGSGIELHPVDGGIVCDHYLRTTSPYVYAAGDVAHWPNKLLDATMRLENWTNAAEQGAHAARNAIYPERAEAYVVVPYFWSDWYGNRIQFVGTAIADRVEFVSGDPQSDRFVAFYRQEDRLVGAATLNEPRKIMELRRLIARGALIDEANSIFEPAPAHQSPTS